MYNPDSLAQKIADILDDRKAEQVVVLDISRLSVLADYFVIASAVPNCRWMLYTMT